MRPLLALLATIAVVLAVVVGSASGLDKPQTFSVLEVDQSDASTDTGFDFQRIPRAGDQFAFKSALYRWNGIRRGARIGRDEGICTFISIPTSGQQFPPSGVCTASAFLPGGQIHVQGVVSFPEGPARFEIPVIGGTGTYTGVRGYLRVRDLGTGDQGHTNLEFHLIP
jgi:hypothetical protein